MVAFNRLVIAGNLVSKPEIKETPSGIPVAKFSIAINTKYKNNKGEIKIADKIKIAHCVTEEKADFEILDLKTMINDLVKFIKDSNSI